MQVRKKEDLCRLHASKLLLLCQVTVYDDNFPPQSGSRPMFLPQAWHWEWAASRGHSSHQLRAAQCFCDNGLWSSEAGSASEHQHQDRDHEQEQEEIWATGHHHHHNFIIIIIIIVIIITIHRCHLALGTMGAMLCSGTLSSASSGRSSWWWCMTLWRRWCSGSTGTRHSSRWRRRRTSTSMSSARWTSLKSFFCEIWTTVQSMSFHF